MSTPPQRRRRRKHLSPSPPESAAQSAARSRREMRTLVLFAVAMLAFGVACWFAFQPVTQLTKQWLGRRLLPELRQHIKDQHWPQAAAAMHDARRWAPNDPEIIRGCLDFITSVGGDPRGTISLIRQLQETGAATLDDLALLGKTHARLGEIAKAREIYDRLSPEARLKPHGLELHADLLQTDGHHQDAAEARRVALEDSLDESSNLRKLALIDLSSSDPSRRKAMRERLWQTARSAGQTSLTAVDLLSRIKNLTVPQADELFRIVEATPATATHETVRFIVLSARMRLSPHLRADIIDQEITRWKKRPVVQTAPLVAWLAEESEFTRILRMVPAQTAARYTDLLPPYVSALRGEGKWQDLNKLLSSGGIDSAFSAQRIRLWQAETQSHLDGNPVRAVQILKRVFEEAGRGDDLEATLEAGSLAEQFGHWELAGSCYQSVAAKHPAARLSMMSRLYALAKSQRDGPAMLTACASLLKLRPEDTAIQLQSLYLQTLLGTVIETAYHKLYTGSFSSSMDQVHLLQALSSHRHGRQEEVSAMLTKVTHPEKLPPGQRVVYAALLKMSGSESGRAFQLVERVSPLLLLPEEKIFLQRAL